LRVRGLNLMESTQKLAVKNRDSGLIIRRLTES
jgi:hypothetical protein